jgi:formate hydrogenlyase subunit 3/multisubunit Na+/H+ antiporter MnhD subunit
MYKPLRVFSYLGGALVLVGLLPVARFLYFYAQGQGNGHVQSVVLGGVLLVFGFVSLLVGIVAELISFNRRLLEILLEKVRRLESDAARRD